ncbi:hypothetical protein Tco_0765667 [Tanacetum coccineum]
MRAHLIRRIARHFWLMSTTSLRFNSLGHAEIVNEVLDNSDEEAEAAGVMDDRLREINQHIYRIGGEVEELIEVVLGMSEEYDNSMVNFKE